MSVCLLVTFVSPTKTAEPNEMPFGGMTWVCQRNHVLDRVPILQREGQFWGLLSGPLKSMGISTVAFQAARKINNCGMAAASGKVPV